MKIINIGVNLRIIIFDIDVGDRMSVHREERKREGGLRKSLNMGVMRGGANSRQKEQLQAMKTFE